MPAYAGMTGKHIGSKPENEGHGMVSLYPWYFQGNMPRFYATLRLTFAPRSMSTSSAVTGGAKPLVPEWGALE